MGWWQYGLQGQNAFPSSGAATTKWSTLKDIQNVRSIGSIPMNPNIPIGQSYPVLLNTWSLGTQLYARLTPEYQNVTVRQGDLVETVQAIRHSVTLQLKNGDSVIDLGTLGSPAFEYFAVTHAGGIPLTPFSIYYRMFAEAQQVPMIPALAFPLDGAGGGLTNQLAAVSTSTGVDIYVIGYKSSGEMGGVEYFYNCPGYKIATIPNTYLENKAWFDPNNDAFDPTDGGDDTLGPGNGVGGLPTAKVYPGTDVDFPGLPSGASAFGFSRLNLFKCTAAELANALDILYSDDTETTLETIIESCKKWWYKPDQYCISLMLSPVSAVTGTAKNIKFGKYDSSQAALPVADQYQVVDCGSVSVPLQYGSFLDFNPYAEAKIFLPFVGFRSININEIMGGTVYCKYYVDMLTGAAVAMVKVSKPSSNSSVLYSYECNVNAQVPLTADNYSNVVSSLLTAGISYGMGNYGMAVSSAVSGVMNMGSPELTQSGSLSSNSGMMGGFTPYICLMFPVASMPNNYSGIKGKPSDTYVSLGSVSGYTVVDQVHLDNINTATDEEIREIESLLKSGVIF